MIANNRRLEMKAFTVARSRSREAGFSVIELMVVVVIMAIVLAASIPALRQHQENVNLTKGSRELESSLKLARTRSVSTNNPVVVVFDTDAGTYLLFEDADDDGTQDAGETGSGPFEVPDKVTIGSVSFASNAVTFTPDGAASETGSVVLVNTRSLAQRIDLTAATGLTYVSDVYECEGEIVSED
jgi:type II secretion system protein H